MRRVGALVLPFVAACAPSALEPVEGQVAEGEPEVRRLVDERLARARRDPGRADAHGDLGLVYEANHMWAEAARSFENAFRLDPEHVLWGYHRALALGELGEPERELEALTELDRRFSGEPVVPYRLGLVLLRNGENDRAEDAFRRALALDQRQPQPKIGLAQVAIDEGRFDEALHLASGVVEAYPEYRHAQFVLGRALAGLGRAEEAATYLRRGLDSHPENMADRHAEQLERYTLNFADRLTKGVELVQERKFDQARVALDSLRQARPDDVRVLNNLAAACIELQRFDEAVEHLERSIRIDPDEFATRINLAQAYRRLGRIEEARAQAERGVEIAPGHAQTHFALAEVLMAAGDLGATRRELETSVRLDPTFAPARFALGSVALRMSDWNLAIESIEAGLVHSPGNVPASLGLVEALLGSGALERAEARLREIERVAGDHPRVRAVREQLTAARR